MRARDANIAVHAVLDEAWAQGKFTGAAAAQYFAQGNNDFPSFKYFEIATLSAHAYPYDSADRAQFFSEAAALLGEEYVWDGPGFRSIDYLAPAGSDATAATADAFVYAFTPEGYVSGKPVIGVSYKLTLSGEIGTISEFFAALGNGDVVYDANAGYEVYHLTIG
ncbi:MAG: hypothetical protein LBC35_04660 [Coriobacteriales bacterium]|jgi:hypothetical protein|nr:hypothetical protein [Coriobacteriales bacterium]